MTVSIHFCDLPDDHTLAEFDISMKCCEVFSSLILSRGLLCSQSTRMAWKPVKPKIAKEQIHEYGIHHLAFQAPLPAFGKSYRWTLCKTDRTSVMESSGRSTLAEVHIIPRGDVKRCVEKRSFGLDDWRLTSHFRFLALTGAARGAPKFSTSLDRLGTWMVLHACRF